MSRCAARSLAALGKRYPYVVGVTMGTVKTAGSDFCTQRYVEGRSRLDRPRLACFTLLGFAWVGCLQQSLYVGVFSRWFPHAERFTALPTVAARLQDRAGLRDLALQTAFVNFIWCPMFYHFFYVFQEFVQGVSSAGNCGSDAGIYQIVSDGLERCCRHFWSALARCRSNLWDDLTVCWSIWIPGHLVTFAVPMWLRMPLTHGLSFLFFSILSFTRGGGQDPEGGDKAK